MRQMAERSLWVCVDGEETREGVPLRLLSAVFSGIQETVYHIAMAESGREVRSRARVPDGIRSKYQLVRVNEHNSVYSVEIAFAPAEQITLPSLEDVRSTVLDKYTRLLDALARSDSDSVSALFPDTAWRRRVLRSVETYCPQKGDQWHLSVSSQGTESPTILSPLIRERISSLVSEPGLESLTVSGELVRVHLDERKLGIFYEPTSRVLDCYYWPELEDLVLENLKGVVHVLGKVQLDQNGLPDKIVDVSDVRPLDLRPLTLKSVECDEGTLVLKEPRLIEPVYEEGQVVFELPDLNVIASGDTREDAVNRLFLDLIWLWKEYVLASRDELSQDAAALADHLRGMVEEVSIRDEWREA